MDYPTDSNAFEAAVLSDLWRQSRLRHGSEAARSRGGRPPPPPAGPHAPMDPRSPNRIWNPVWGGFSGWVTVGTLANYPPQGNHQQQNQGIVRILQGFDPNVHNNTHMVYRLVYTGPSTQNRKRTVYIGSAVRGQVAQRLRDHQRGGNRASNALHNYLNRTRVKPSNIRVDVGYVTNQRRYPPQSMRDNFNYNTLFLIEKILQRRERPRIWDPTDRTFDEAPIQLRSWMGW